MRSSRAFTIVELLVVIAIIAVLMSILVPALQSARVQAKAAICLTRLKAMGQAMAMYAQEYKDYVPRGTTVSSVPDDFWSVKFMPYVGGGRASGQLQWYDIKTFDCPAFPYKEQTVDYIINNWDFTGKDPINGVEWGTANSGSPGGAVPSKLSLWEHPEDTIYLIDYESSVNGYDAIGHGLAPATHLMLVFRYDNEAVVLDKLRWLDLYGLGTMPWQGAGGRRVARDRHRNGANALFVDTHVRFVKNIEHNRYLWGGPWPLAGDIDSPSRIPNPLPVP